MSKHTDIEHKANPADIPYGSAVGGPDQAALWAKYGRDRVKSVQGFREMTLGQIAAALDAADKGNK